MNRKLILFDIDGTIISYKGESHIPDMTVKTIEQLKKAGHLVAIATGRSRFTTKKLMDALGIQMAILHDGAHIMVDDRTVYEKKIDSITASGICRMLSATEHSVFASDGHDMYVHNLSVESRMYLEGQYGESGFIKPIAHCTSSVYCFQIYEGPDKTPIVLPEYEGLIFHRALNELAVKGVSKGSALVFLAGMFGITIEHTIAVGDGLNDIEMLQIAGTGIAVANACDELKRVSDLVTGDLDEGGMFRVFKDLDLVR